MPSSHSYSSAEPKHERRAERRLLVEGAGSLEGQDAVTEHLGPDAQAAPLHEAGNGGIRHRSDPGLDGGAVADGRGHLCPDVGSRLVGRHRGVDGELLLDLDPCVDVVDGDERVAECPGHQRVQLSEHQTAARPDRLEGGRQHVDLGAERDHPVARQRGVDDHHVRGQRGGEQPWRQRQPAGHVGEPRVPAEAGADEGRLGDHPVVDRQPSLGIEQVQPERRQGRGDALEQRQRRGEVPAGDDPGLWCRGLHCSGETDGLLELDDPHGRPSPRTGKATAQGAS